MDDETLAADEARRAARHEAIKSHVEREVNAEVVQHAEVYRAAEAPHVAAAASELRNRAVADVISTEHEVDRAHGFARASQVLNYVFGLVYGLLIVRFALVLMGARDTGFVSFIRTVTDPFYAPFRGIVESPTVEGGMTLALPIAVALIAYILLHAAITGLLKMAVHKQATV